MKKSEELAIVIYGSYFNRNKKIVECRDIHGWSFAQIGRCFYISGERARQIYMKYRDYAGVCEIKQSTIMRINEIEKFLYWLADLVMDEEYWELNAVSYDEIILRKLTRCGILKCDNGRYVIDRNYYSIAVELVAEKRRGSKK